MAAEPVLNWKRNEDFRNTTQNGMLFLNIAIGVILVLLGMRYLRKRLDVGTTVSVELLEKLFRGFANAKSYEKRRNRISIDL
jgi:hypothetical protein